MDDLGPLQTTFGPNRANAKLFLYVLPVFALVGLILLGPIPVGGVVMLLLAAGMFAGYRLQMRAKVDIHERGLALTDWRGRSQSLRWDEVTGVTEAIGYHTRTGTPIQWAYRATTRDGREIKLDMAYERTRALGALVLEQTGKLLLPAAREALKKKQAVAFGDQIALSAGGLVSGGETLPWEQVEKIRFTRTGDLIVHRREQRTPWKMVMHPRIANYPVFEVLLREVAGDSLAAGKVEKS